MWMYMLNHRLSERSSHRFFRWKYLCIRKYWKNPWAIYEYLNIINKVFCCTHPNVWIRATYAQHFSSYEFVWIHIIYTAWIIFAFQWETTRMLLNTHKEKVQMRPFTGLINTFIIKKKKKPYSFNLRLHVL